MTKALQMQRVFDCDFRVTTEVILVSFVVMFVIDIIVLVALMAIRYLMKAIQSLLDSVPRETLIWLSVHFGYAIYNRIFGLV